MSNRFSTSERRGTIVVVILMAISVFMIVMNRLADAKVPEAIASEVSGKSEMLADSVDKRKTVLKRHPRESREHRKTRSDKRKDYGTGKKSRVPLSEPVN